MDRTLIANTRIFDVLGFTPMARLVMATWLGGEIMVHPGELGQVKPGSSPTCCSSRATP